MLNKFDRPQHKHAPTLPYGTMTIAEIAALPVGDLADDDAHIWLWTTTRTLHDGFHLLEEWGFKFLTSVCWVKPSGLGAWWISRHQQLLFGYKGKCRFKNRLKPNVLFAPSRRHSQKPAETYDLIESVSHGPYLELFARPPARPGWTSLGNGIDGREIQDAIAETLHTP